MTNIGMKQVGFSSRVKFDPAKIAEKIKNPDLVEKVGDTLISAGMVTSSASVVNKPSAIGSLLSTLGSALSSVAEKAKNPYKNPS